MMKSHLAAVFFITCFLCCVFVTSVPVPTPPVPPCPDQFEIILAFKNEFPPPNCNRIWNTPNFISCGRNICSWTKDANYFDDETGVVTSLSLPEACISGTIHANSSLFKLHHLKHVDLCRNQFESSSFPAGFGRLTKLEYLDLSENGFIGEVPSSISNLSRLITLNLSYNKLNGDVPSSISNLSRLIYLNLAYNKFIGRFPHAHNLTLLSYINLSSNHFSETIPSSLFTMPSLQYLHMRQKYVRDPLENMSSSATSKLVFRDMAKNLLSCRILEPISKLANLTYLDLSFQNTTCTSNFDFLHLKSLELLDISGNSVSRLITGSENLTDLILSSCNITEFPTFIKTLRNLEMLDVSKNSLEGKVPEWLWALSSLEKVNLFHNFIDLLEGSPKVLLNSSLYELDLSANAFQGSFPIIPPTIEVMAASNNNFTGDIPLAFCDVSKLRLLDLLNNNFSGSILQCLSTMVSLIALKLSNNNFIGRLPDMRNGLNILDVGYNKISGKLPRSLVNCTMLKFLNVESNRTTDTFPFWLKALPDLEVIVLRSNRFHGSIFPPERQPKTNPNSSRQNM